MYEPISYHTGYYEEETLNPTINSRSFQSNLRVLVAEDNPTNIKLVQLVIKRFTSVFDSASNGQLAFEKFIANKYDIIFMDVQMPEMNGYEATKKIRFYEKENNLTPVKIVAMTAYDLNENDELYLKSGMNQYLQKPFKRTEMIKIIKSLLS